MFLKFCLNILLQLSLIMQNLIFNDKRLNGIFLENVRKQVVFVFEIFSFDARNMRDRETCLRGSMYKIYRELGNTIRGD